VKKLRRLKRRPGSPVPGALGDATWNGQIHMHFEDCYHFNDYVR